MHQKFTISQETIQAVEKIITGNQIYGKKLSPYQTGPDLVSFFNQFGSIDSYQQGFPSRWVYVEEKLKEFNGTGTLGRIIDKSLDPRRFLDPNFSLEEAISFLNVYLKYDRLKLEKIGDVYKLLEIQDLVRLPTPTKISKGLNQEFIREQIQKCENKISQNDYDGSITNARTLVEAVLRDIENNLDLHAPKYNGNLIKLYKRVQKLLSLNPKEKEITDNLKQVLSGLTSIVNGISSLRNKISDAHARQYKPSFHHAKLVVNSARTLVSFLFETEEYQNAKKKAQAVKNKIRVIEELEDICLYCGSGIGNSRDICVACGKLNP